MQVKSIKPITETFDELIPSPIWELYIKEIKPLPDPYIRVTELISSPLRRRLIRENLENIRRRLNTIHYQILGTIIHSLFELKEFQEILQDMRFYYQVGDEGKVLELAKRLVNLKTRKQMTFPFEDFIILGEFDLLEDDIIYDFKVTSEFVVLNQKFDRYEKQLQVYRYMYEKTTGEKVRALKNVFFLRDFSVTRSKFDSPLVVVEYEIWDDEKVESYIRERLQLHKDGNFCSDEDMLLIVKYKVGNKYFSSEEKAVDYALKKRAKVEKEFMPLGCMHFCEVSDFCPQWQALKELMQEKN